MKTPIRLAFAALLLAAVSLVPVQAQDLGGLDLEPGTKAVTGDPPTLTFTGNVQICTSASAGATWSPAKPGQPLPVGSHMMVGPGATAQLEYSNGAIVNFTEPGLYTVNAATGALTGVATASSIVAANTGFIAFAGLIAAAGVSSSVADEDENLLVPLSE